MEQHPLPQDITAYRFRLVGSMTLKQFLELAGGIVVAWLIFSSPLNFLIKWTLGPLLAFLGFALAFIPFEDRPLDQWIVNFFKAIYQPTQFVYKPTPKQMDFMAPVKAAPQTSAASGPTASPELLADYLKTLPSAPSGGFDTAEQKYLDYIRSLFGALGTKVSPRIETETAQPSTPTKTVKGVRVRKLMHPQMCLLPHATAYQAPAQPKQASMPVKPIQPSATPVSAPTKPQTKDQAVKAVPQTKAPVAVKAKTQAKAVKPAAKPATKPAPVAPAPAPAQGPVTEAVFAKDVVLPQQPDKPNLLAGITLDEKGKILPNVILEIKDGKGLPVRALKSNKLGQFFIATPLEDGVYQISAEADNKRFAIMKLEAKNEVIPPLKIQAQG